MRGNEVKVTVSAEVNTILSDLYNQIEYELRDDYEDGLEKAMEELDKYKNIIDKATKELEKLLPLCIMPNNTLIHGTEKAKVLDDLLNILQGKSDE